MTDKLDEMFGAHMRWMKNVNRHTALMGMAMNATFGVACGLLAYISFGETPLSWLTGWLFVFSGVTSVGTVCFNFVTWRQNR